MSKEKVFSFSGRFWRDETLSRRSFRQIFGKTNRVHRSNRSWTRRLRSDGIVPDRSSTFEHEIERKTFGTERRSISRSSAEKRGERRSFEEKKMFSRVEFQICVFFSLSEQNVPGPGRYSIKRELDPDRTKSEIKGFDSSRAPFGSLSKVRRKKSEEKKIVATFLFSFSVSIRRRANFRDQEVTTTKFETPWTTFKRERRVYRKIRLTKVRRVSTAKIENQKNFPDRLNISSRVSLKKIFDVRWSNPAERRRSTERRSAGFLRFDAMKSTFRVRKKRKNWNFCFDAFSSLFSGPSSYDVTKDPSRVKIEHPSSNFASNSAREIVIEVREKNLCRFFFSKSESRILFQGFSGPDEIRGFSSFSSFDDATKKSSEIETSVQTAKSISLVGKTKVLRWNDERHARSWRLWNKLHKSNARLRHAQRKSFSRRWITSTGTRRLSSRLTNDSTIKKRKTFFLLSLLVVATFWRHRSPWNFQLDFEQSDPQQIPRKDRTTREKVRNQSKESNRRDELTENRTFLFFFRRETKNKKETFASTINSNFIEQWRRRTIRQSMNNCFYSDPKR